MFGRMFQQSGLPSSYRRVAYLQSDGVAYINLDYEPLPTWSWNVALSIPVGTQFTIQAKYDNTITSVKPGTILGCLNSLCLQTSCRSRDKVPDSGTTSVRMYATHYGWITWSVSYSRDASGTYSGTFSSPDDPDGECIRDLSSDGSCSGDYWDEYAGCYQQFSATPTYPTQADSASPTYDRFALKFPTQNSSENDIDSYDGGASQTFYSNTFTELTVVGESIHNYNKMQVRTGSTTYDIGSQGHGQRHNSSGPLFLFCNNENSLPADFDATVKVRSLSFTNSTQETSQSTPVYSLVRNLVACVRKRDEKPGMYDLKNHRFFTNAADTGEFLFAELTD